MTRSQFDLFLLGSSVLCLVMTLLTLLRYKSRGLSALALAGAFAVLGGVLLLLRADVDRNIVIGGFVLVGLLLMADFALRSGDRSAPPG